jgi:hypothetical protein
MSEYQYHEWQTIDRLLTPAERAAVNELSSHIEVSSSKAVVTYNWGDFKHDPRQVLLKYFDAYFYQANWGSMRLMFRFPKGMLEEEELEPYWAGEYVSFKTAGEYQVLDVDFNPEDSGWLDEVNTDLSDYIPLRSELLQGDYRLLYLAWLKEMTFSGEPVDEQEDDTDSPGDDLEPPVPPGLKKLSPALQNFVRAFDLDPFLVQAAAEVSPDMRNPLSLDYREWVARLPRPECDAFLTRLAEGDPAVGMALRKRLGEFLPKDQSLKPGGTRPLGKLLKRARQLKEMEKKRQAEEARLKHIAAMKALAKREPQVWQEVNRLLETGSKTASVYGEATTLLMQLKQLSEFQDTREIFSARLHQLVEKYASRPSLIKRWREQGWI